MDEKKMGSLILKSVGSENEAAIIDFLAGLFKKSTPEKIRTLVQQAPAVLTRKITEQQAGPVVAKLIQLGAVAEFKPAAPSPSTAVPGAAPLTEAALPEASGTTQPAGPEPAAAQDPVCSQCGRSHPEEEMLVYNDLWICAACKPAFVQKLKEGEKIDGQLIYAGFWIRGGAKVVDGIILFVITFVVGLLMNLLGGVTGNGQNPPAILIFTNLFNVVLAAAYIVWFVGKYAATPGKMLCGLKIVMPDGDRVSYPRALGRYFAEWISSMIFGIGYIMAAFDSEKRTLHDRICGTRVVKK